MFVLPGKDLPKRVAMVRGTGMKIYDKGNFRTPFKFAGVLIAKGEGINEFLRKIEPPTHSAWEPDRHENPEEAKAIIKKLYSWINEQVRSITVVTDEEELDVEGLSQYLADKDDPLLEVQVQKEIEQNCSKGEKAAPKDIDIDINYRQKKQTAFVGINEGNDVYQETAAGAEDAEDMQESGDGSTEGSESGSGGENNEGQDSSGHKDQIGNSKGRENEGNNSAAPSKKCS